MEHFRMEADRPQLASGAGSGKSVGCANSSMKIGDVKRTRSASLRETTVNAPSMDLEYY